MRYDRGTQTALVVIGAISTVESADISLGESTTQGRVLLISLPFVGFRSTSHISNRLTFTIPNHHRRPGVDQATQRQSLPGPGRRWFFQFPLPSLPWPVLRLVVHFSTNGPYNSGRRSLKNCQVSRTSRIISRSISCTSSSSSA